MSVTSVNMFSTTTCYAGGGRRGIAAKCHHGEFWLMELWTKKMGTGVTFQYLKLKYTADSLDVSDMTRGEWLYDEVSTTYLRN